MTWLGYLTMKEAKKKLRPYAMTITKRDGEYRVNHLNGTEATAYYTNDIGDAICTGVSMSLRYQRED
jgi:hypothetical protein